VKFSILIPTRSRPELLAFAVESVRLQDHADWEIVVSDNASDTDIGRQMQALGDARIRTRRHDRLIPVTDNWNAALEMATGDYFVMLGDDDALLPGCLRRINALIEEWQPEAIYAQASQYGYPGVIPGHAEAFVQTGYNAFLAGARKPFPLDPDTAMDMVRAAMEFRILYGFNMQHFVISRRLAERLASRGPFFQSPYPDYYAANAVLLTANPLLASPDPVALIGISPKSFGFYYFNDRESDGVAFLQNVADTDIAERLRTEVMPGSNMNDSWLCAMETLARNFQEVRGLRVRYHRYRRLQFNELLKAKGRGGFAEVFRYVHGWEVPFYAIVFVAFAATRVLPAKLRSFVLEHLIHALFSPAPRFDPKRVAVPYTNILEAVRANAR
jgi:glycosyltransferase involved in cell wall biosynthesis